MERPACPPFGSAEKYVTSCFPAARSERPLMPTSGCARARSWQQPVSAPFWHGSLCPCTPRPAQTATFVGFRTTLDSPTRCCGRSLLSASDTGVRPGEADVKAGTAQFWMNQRAERKVPATTPPMVMGVVSRRNTLADSMVISTARPTADTRIPRPTARLPPGRTCGGRGDGKRLAQCRDLGGQLRHQRLAGGRGPCEQDAQGQVGQRELEQENERAPGGNHHGRLQREHQG